MPDIVNTLAMLGIVLAVILVAAWVTRRVPGLRSNSSANLHLRGALAVGGRERVLLVECDGARVLIGVAPGCVRPLAMLPPADSTDGAGEDYAQVAARIESQVQRR